MDSSLINKIIEVSSTPFFKNRFYDFLIELGNRIYKAGFKILLEPKAIVAHRDSINYWEIARQKFRHARGDVKQGIGEKFFDF